MSNKRLLILTCCLLALGGCNIIYKQNIQQGNAIEQDKLEQLKLGMTMNQVAFLMGTPAIRDPFHHDRWDYFNSIAIRGGDPVTRLVTLRFENAILTEMTGVDFDDQDAVIGEETGDTEKTGTDAPIETETTAEAPIDDEPADESSVDETPALDDPPVAEPVAPAVTSHYVQQPEPVAKVTGEQTAEAPAPSAVDAPVPDDRAIAGAAADVGNTLTEPAVAGKLATSATDSMPPAVPPTGQWAIQLGAFDSLKNAQDFEERANQAGFQTSITHQELASIGTRYLVRTAGYDSRTQADRQLQMINTALEIQGFLIPPSN
jgi:outer membrane protein assembly factor BamE